MFDEYLFGGEFTGLDERLLNVIYEMHGNRLAFASKTFAVIVDKEAVHLLSVCHVPLLNLFDERLGLINPRLELHEK